MTAPPIPTLAQITSHHCLVQTNCRFKVGHLLGGILVGLSAVSYAYGSGLEPKC